LQKLIPSYYLLQAIFFGIFILFFFFRSSQTLGHALDQAHPVGALRQREVSVLREVEVAQGGGPQVSAQRFRHALGVLDWKKIIFLIF
jgi:hypothetical protein